MAFHHLWWWDSEVIVPGTIKKTLGYLKWTSLGAVLQWLTKYQLKSSVLWLFACKTTVFCYRICKWAEWVTNAADGPQLFSVVWWVPGLVRCWRWPGPKGKGLSRSGNLLWSPALRRAAQGALSGQHQAGCSVTTPAQQLLLLAELSLKESRTGSLSLPLLNKALLWTYSTGRERLFNSCSDWKLFFTYAVKALNVLKGKKKGAIKPRGSC